MNRLLQTDLEDFKLQDKVFDRQSNDESVMSEVKVEAVPVEISEMTKKFYQTTKDHIIALMSRTEPQKKSYYDMVWENKSLDEILEQKIPGVHESVPEGGFDPSRVIDNISVEAYFESMLKLVAEKAKMSSNPDLIDLSQMLSSDM